MESVLVTGAAGFIGAHAAAALADAGLRVVGCDAFNGYYDPRLKRARVDAFLAPRGIPCHEIDLAEPGVARKLLGATRFDAVLHLAAQAGVRHSIEAPMDYVRSNLVAFTELIEASRRAGLAHFFYASSSSVYGERPEGAFQETDRCDTPASFYAATKRANELMAHSFAKVHGLPVTGLRFFTVYGPWGRPDMAYFSFAEKIRRGEPITVFAGGELLRDFTYIDDATSALTRLITATLHAPPPDGVPARVLNIGHHRPVRVIEFVRHLEAALGHEARIEFAPMQAGDVPFTCADPERLRQAIGPIVHTPLATGLERFARWLERWGPLSQAAELAAIG